MAVRVRRDAGRLAEWDDVLLWYARGVGEMQKRRLNDPLSWRYQAGIHEYRRSRDPLRKPTDRLPSQTQQRRFWSQCQHNSWFFLPWHRWYLYYFEQILIYAIGELGGPADTWALPYWNYGDAANQPGARVIPAAFRATALPDGSPNRDTSDPLAAEPAGPGEEAPEVPEAITVAERRIPEMIGASEGPVPLTLQPTSTTVAVTAPTGPAAAEGLEGLEAAGVEPPRVFINVENVTGVGRPRRYSVYVNGVFAGIIPLFGMEEATIPTDRHAGGGLQYRIDATRAVRQLQAEGRWDPATMRVTFVPDEKLVAELESLEAAGEETAAPAFSVGRVSVYIA